MSHTITIANQKGGVGKTTVSMSLISSLHRRGYRVLGVDLDPQGSLGFSAGLDIENNHTVYDVLRGDVPIEQAIVQADMGDFLLSNILLSTAEREFDGRDREYLLKGALSKVSQDYDFIVVDTPPGLSVLTTNAYAASNWVVIPTKPNILEVLAVSQIRDTIKEVQASLNPSLRVLGILINLYDKRLNLGKEVTELMESLAREMDTRVFQSKIRTAVGVAEAPAHGESILNYTRASSAGEDFSAFTEELLRVLLKSI